MNQMTTGGNCFEPEKDDDIYLAKKMAVEKAMDELKMKGCGKIVVFIDCTRTDVGFITRVETIEIKKY